VPGTNDEMEMLFSLIVSQLISDGVSQVDATTAAGHILRQLQEVYGGSKLHVPSLRHVTEQKVLQDLAEGKPPKDVARRNGVSLSAVYRAIHRQRIRKQTDSGTTQKTAERPRKEATDDPGFGTREWAL